MRTARRVDRSPAQKVEEYARRDGHIERLDAGRQWKGDGKVRALTRFLDSPAPSFPTTNATRGVGGIDEADWPVESAANSLAPERARNESSSAQVEENAGCVK